MFHEIARLSQHFIKIYNRDYKRYFLNRWSLSNRFSIITGQRGVGKTTCMIQYLHSTYPDDFESRKVLYVQADHIIIGNTSLYSITEDFYHLGGELICFDEIHKVSGWSQELKSINDTFSELKIIASGSSALEVHRGSHDLSRRAVTYNMVGLSFREFVEVQLNLSLGSYSLEEILSEHTKIAPEIIIKIEAKKAKILALFKEYCSFGYYPYFLEFQDKSLFFMTLEQNLRTTVESDLISIYPTLTGSSIKKLLKLLSIIAASVPFSPDLKHLKKILDIGDERTLKNYLKYLEDAGIIRSLPKSGRGLQELEKPEKIYLNNTNQTVALVGAGRSNPGNERETFLLSMLSPQYRVIAAPKGDFLVADKYTIEVGGKNKKSKQIRGVDRAYLALDGLETGILHRVPLWIFGFLY